MLLQARKGVVQGEIEKGPEVLKFTLDGICYKLRGIKYHSAVNLKVAISAAVNGDSHMDRFDLYFRRGGG